MTTMSNPPIIVESLEPDGGLHVGARVRVTDGDKSWDGVVTTGTVDHDHDWVDVSDLADDVRREMCTVAGCDAERWEERRP